MTMKSMLSSVLVALALAFSAAADEAFTYEVAGNFTLMPDGRATGMSFTQRAPMAVRELVRSHTDGWRFAPVLEGGEAVAVPVNFSFSLIGTPVGEYVNFNFDHERFSEAFALNPIHGTPPIYPVDALRDGIAAEVILFVEIDDEGNAVEVHAWRVDLADSAPVRRLRGNAAARHARAFGLAAEGAGRQFQFVAPAGRSRTVGYYRIRFQLEAQSGPMEYTPGATATLPWTGPRIDLMVEVLTPGADEEAVAGRRLRRVDEDFEGSGW